MLNVLNGCTYSRYLDIRCPRCSCQTASPKIKQAAMNISRARAAKWCLLQLRLAMYVGGSARTVPCQPPPPAQFSIDFRVRFWKIRLRSSEDLRFSKRAKKKSTGRTPTHIHLLDTTHYTATGPFSIPVSGINSSTWKPYGSPY